VTSGFQWANIPAGLVLGSRRVDKFAEDADTSGQGHDDDSRSDEH
jgi:hypothetical protein